MGENTDSSSARFDLAFSNRIHDRRIKFISRLARFNLYQVLPVCMKDLENGTNAL